MKVKYFGLIRCEIHKDEKRIELSFLPRGRDQLDAKHPQRCLNWAVTALQPYLDKGYVFTGPEAVSSG
jgi:hypothetical protein